MVSAMLTLPQLGNPYLSRSTFTVLSQLMSASVQEDDSNVATQLPEIIHTIHSSSPIKTDTTQASAWMLVLANAVVSYSTVDSSGCEKEISKSWKSVWVFLESVDSATRKTAAESLDLISKCLTPSMIKSATKDRDNSILGKMILQCRTALDSLAFARSIAEVLSVISSMIGRLRYHEGSRSSPTAAEVLMAPIIQKIGDLRTQKDFEYKESADSTLGVAMRVLGPEALLKILPPNLEPADR
jgi:ribosomal RNA-processing protein 12